MNLFNYVSRGEDGDIKSVYVGKIVGQIIIFFFVVLPILFFTWTIISPGERGIIVRLGNINRVIDPGIHLKFPYIESVKVFDVKTVKMEVKTLAYSKDIQTVDAGLVLNYHLLPDRVNFLYQEIGMDYEVSIIDPAIQESVKAVSAQFTAQDLVEQRAKVKDEIKKLLSERLSGRNIIVDELSITNFDFTDEYEKAVEAKQVAQQDALQAKNKLEQVKFEAEQRVAQATAEAEAIRIQAQAITQQGGEDYVNLKAVEKWNGMLPTQMIPNATLPFINLNK
jgi:regulator of protease activity HflC (stomatin/prohibitin superfamily)